VCGADEGALIEMAKDNTTDGQNSPRPRRRAPATTAKEKVRSSAVTVPSSSEVNDRGIAAAPAPPPTATAGHNMHPKGAESARKRPTRDEVARRAFEIYSRRGTHGRDLEDWLQAERELGGGKTN
jgi:hypothetical protein